MFLRGLCGWLLISSSSLRLLLSSALEGFAYFHQWRDFDFSALLSVFSGKSFVCGSVPLCLRGGFFVGVANCYLLIAALSSTWARKSINSHFCDIVTVSSMLTWTSAGLMSAAFRSDLGTSCFSHRVSEAGITLSPVPCRSNTGTFRLPR